MSKSKEIASTYFTGTVIITDPCYLINSSYFAGGKIDPKTGQGLDKVGIEQFLWAETGIGDWNCEMLETISINTFEPIGGFTADAGLVGVFKLDDIQALNDDAKTIYNSDKDIAGLVNAGLAVVLADFRGLIKIINKDGNEYNTVTVLGSVANKTKKDVRKNIQLHSQPKTPALFAY